MNIEKELEGFVMTVSLEGTDKIKENLNMLENKLDIIIEKYEKILELQEKVK